MQTARNKCLMDFMTQKLAELCRKMSRVTNLDFSSINAKVGNYKSVAGVTNDSHASLKTTEFYRRYGRLCRLEIQKILEERSFS